MKAYVINLLDRTDRWHSVLLQSSKLNMEVIRIEAKSGKDFQGEADELVLPSIRAIWESHKIALHRFLQTEEDQALILEDDFHLSKNFSRKIESIESEKSYDFIQLGFLKINTKESLEILYSNFYDFFLKLIEKITKKYGRLFPKISQKVFIGRQNNVSWGYVIDDVRSGAQAYVVSRRFAEAMLRVNDPVFLSTDLLYISFSQMRTLRMARLRKSIVGQNKMKSSVQSRFLMKAD